MTNTIKNFKEAKRWQKRHNAHAPQIGELAPDFELRDVEGNHPVRLSNFQGQKPVALVFGSFT